MLECEILELPSHARHAESMGKRSIQVPRFLRDARSLLDRQVVESPHVVQAVGELDDDDARVFCDRKKELAIILDLPVLRRIEREMPDLRQAVDYLRDLGAEMRVDFGNGDIGVFDDVVNEPACDCYGVELQLRENLCDFDAVRYEILT